MNPPALNRRKKASILVVEDESIVRADIEDYLKSFGYHVCASVASGEEAKRQATRLRPDLVLMDIVLAGKIDGIEAGKYIQTKLSIPVVFVTAHGDEHTLERAKLNAPFGYVLKPFSDRELRTAIEIALFRHRTEGELCRLQQQLSKILESMEEAVLVTDKFGFITFVNAQAASLTGWRSKKAIGKALGEVVRFVDGVTRKPMNASLGEITRLTNGDGNHDPVVLLKQSERKSETYVKFKSCPLTDEQGNFDGAITKIYPV